MSNLLARLLTAVVAVPILLLAIFLPSPLAVFCIVILATAIGLREWMIMTLAGADRVDISVGVVLGTALSTLLYCFGEQPMVYPLAVAFSSVAVLLYYLVRHGAMETVAARASYTIAGFFYVGLLIFLALLKQRREGDGAWWVVAALCIAWLSDTGAYFAGRFIGPLWPKKLYETVSPKKTVIGAVGGLLASWLAIVLAKFWYFPSLSWADTATLAIPANVLGQAGDLCESLIKRSVGVKDSGALLPGHGGMLDRIDALLFVCPYVYCWARFRYGA